MVFAMLTNRTFLVNYMGYKDECHELLDIQSWIPPERKWASEFHIYSEPVYSLPLLWDYNPAIPGYDQAYLNTSSVDTANPIKTIYPGKEWGYVDWSKDEHLHLLPNNYAREMARDLYSLGDIFLYGAIMRNSFDFSRKVKLSLPSTYTLSDGEVRKVRPMVNETYRIAVHARHNHAEEDGCDVRDIVGCLEQVLAPQVHQDTPCEVVILSDRECTISMMSKMIPGAFNCSVLTASHESAPKVSKRKGAEIEHGPFAGMLSGSSL